MNIVTLMGRLTATPELKLTQSGLSVCSFTLAVTRSYGENKTDFINIVAWRQTAEFITKYFQKGSMLALQGSIQVRTYEDKTGAKRTATEVIADKVFFTGEKKTESKAENAADVYDEELPF